MLKKIFVFLTIISSLFIYSEVNAVTIADYRKDLADLEEKKRINDENSAQTQAKIKEAEKQVENIKLSIQNTMIEMERTEKEIELLEDKIVTKEDQIKQLVTFLQLSDSENFYLKYIFGSENFTDLIYRVSVIQQLTTKSDELIKEMNGLIKENEDKIKELENKKVELNELNQEVLKQIQNLGSQSSKYFDESIDIDDQIKASKKQIQFYIDEGCGETQDLRTCTTSIPIDSKFIRPVKTGVVTDNYGLRSNPCSVCSLFHKGIDIGGNREGTAVFAAAAGKVVSIDKFSCGGRVLTIDHNINGTYYTTRYWHLYSIAVKVGDIVAQGQTVAYVGGGNTAYRDTCSNGAHLHFEVLSGHYNASRYPNGIMDPRNVVSFPAYGVWW